MNSIDGDLPHIALAAEGKGGVAIQRLNRRHERLILVFGVEQD